MIKQRNNQDCGVACLAMYCKKSYEEIELAIKLRLNREAPICGLNNEELAIIMGQFGFRPMQIFTLLPYVPAIITVPSITTRKTFHYIYFDGKTIKDPGRADTYTMKDFKSGFPLSDAVICENDYIKGNTKLPSHYHNHFDWEYVNLNNDI